MNANIYIYIYICQITLLAKGLKNKDLFRTWGCFGFDIQNYEKYDAGRSL